MLGIVLIAAAALTSAQDAPPGLVLVEGGKTQIGSTVEEVEPLVLAREELRAVLAAQTPRHTVDVEDFFLMPNEVTNEQYAEFVKATRSKPPRSWGSRALQNGQAAFLEEQGRAKQEAKATGLPFEPKVFDPEAWWEANWEDAAWEIPRAELTNPVVFVTYREAQRYARWAGMRLMTEFEFQRAGRGDTARNYPWGEDWDDKKYCQSLHSGRDASVPVGSFPEGAANGIYDLAGNVWEWTSSPFTEYPGYTHLRFTDKKKRVIECLAPFDPNQRVIVSGSYQMDKLGLRLTTRMNTDRTQSTSAIGFRCAASPTRGLDAATWIIDQDLRANVLGGEMRLAPQLTCVLRRWSAVPGTAKIGGYAVVTGYDHLLACPRADVRASSPSDLAELTSKGGPLFVGFLDVPRPMLKPELDAGTYLIAWHGAGKLPEERPEQQGMRLPAQEQDVTPFYAVPGYVADKDCYLFYSRTGEPQVAIEASPVASEKMRATSIKLEPFVAPDPKTLPKGKAPPTPMDTVRFTFSVASATSRAKGLIFDLPILVTPGTYNATWR